MSKILIAGGSGLIGYRLCQLLTERSYKVSLLSRRSDSNGLYPVYQWDPIAKQMGELDNIKVYTSALNLNEVKRGEQILLPVGTFDFKRSIGSYGRSCFNK